MRTTDLLEEVYLGVSSNKVRTGLTMLGIIIGIASVIAMLSIGQGTKNQIQQNIESIGSNLLLVMPGMQRAAGQAVSAGRGSSQTLTLEDADAIISVNGVVAVAPESSSRYQITAKGTNTNTSVVGTTPAYLTVRNLAISIGSFFSDSQVTSKAKVAVIGPTTRDDLFGADSNPIGQKIRINNIDFTVVGVTVAKGGSGMSNQDDMVFVPISSKSTYLTGGDFVGTISIQVADQDTMTLVQADVTSLLMERHKISNPTLADFSIMNQSDLVSTASSVVDTFSMLLASIASISLLVGGIGIMNMMLTTVTERTREIGLRKAIGAENNEIVSQFLGEAMLLTLIGGLIGIGVGYGASKLVSTLMSTPTVVSMQSILLAVGVSVAIGLVFGYYPAKSASKLNPIQALRYE